MDVPSALVHLNALIGEDLRQLADMHGVTVWSPAVRPGQSIPTGARLNKGWAGLTVERVLGLPPNCSQRPDFGSWELKVIPLKRRPDGSLCVKETMAITMINPEDVMRTPFEESHLYAKLLNTVVVARVFEDVRESRSVVFSVGTFGLEDEAVRRTVQSDYELVRQTINTQGFDALSGRLGTLVQPRTKGPGHGSKSRAFYARSAFVARIVGLEDVQNVQRTRTKQLRLP